MNNSIPNLQDDTGHTLRVAGIVDGTAVDGPGLRTSIYFAGCDHRCPGCHNPHTWPFDAGEDIAADELLRHIADNDFDVTFSGGDPMYRPNVWCRWHAP